MHKIRLIDGQQGTQRDRVLRCGNNDGIRFTRFDSECLGRITPEKEKRQNTCGSRNLFVVLQIKAKSVTRQQVSIKNVTVKAAPGHFGWKC